MNFSAVDLMFNNSYNFENEPTRGQVMNIAAILK